MTRPPKRLTSYKRLKKGEFIFRSAEWMPVVKLRQEGSHVPVYAASSRSGRHGKCDRHGRLGKKLKLVHQYNHHKGGVNHHERQDLEPLAALHLDRQRLCLERGNLAGSSWTPPRSPTSLLPCSRQSCRYMQRLGSAGQQTCPVLFCQ